MEDRLRELVDAGEFADLPGQGQPLPKEPFDASGDRWAAFHVLANSNVLPEWAQLGRDIEAEHLAIARRARTHVDWLSRRRRDVRDLPAERIIDATRASRARDAHVREELARAVGLLNEKVARYNAIVPAAGLQIVPFTVERVFEAVAPGC